MDPIPSWHTSRVEPRAQPSFVNYETLHRVGVDNIQTICDLRETYIPLPRSDWNETNKWTRTMILVYGLRKLLVLLAYTA